MNMKGQGRRDTGEVRRGRDGPDFETFCADRNKGWHFFLSATDHPCLQFWPLDPNILCSALSQGGTIHSNPIQPITKVKSSQDQEGKQQRKKKRSLLCFKYLWLNMMQKLPKASQLRMISFQFNLGRRMHAYRRLQIYFANYMKF